MKTIPGTSPNKQGVLVLAIALQILLMKYSKRQLIDSTLPLGNFVLLPKIE